MKVYTKTFEVYQYKELSKESKEVAINNYINFIIEVIPYNDLSDNIKKAIDKAEAMYTPWFTGNYIYEYALLEIEENLEKESFLINGEIFR